NFMGKAITVTTSGGPSVTTINGGAARGTVVLFITNEGSSSVLSGFTITNGVAGSSNFYSGGGIFIYNASPTVRGNVITQNWGGSGGGIAAWSSSAVIQGNTITNNHHGYSGGAGGGIYVAGSGSVQIISNTITGNFWDSGDGGGIALDGAGTATVESNTIIG